MNGSITLRPLTLDDARVLAEWQTDAVLAAHAGWRPTSEAAEGEGWWRTSILNPDPLLLRLGVIHAGHLVGYVDLYGGEADERELGYLIGPSSQWGRGLATAAGEAAIAHGFEALGLQRIWAEAVAANLASVRVVEKLGLRSIGRGEAETFLGAESHYERFEILRDDWLARS
ncbi:GNAT family protein [Microcella daejeonensis]|uniref:GNAT family N-acetyltransferase n=1 Tax=Microcella daejeonensis TaxID=2994971 RepID=UPI0022701962|nr:GNAT family protein [Microcella daejeonensis]WAB84598.1 GNAT family protein [Microcella daejeonensis]